jgi:chemotaxis protein CheC
MKQYQEMTDVLQELINIGIGRAAGMLNEMLDTHVILQVPIIRIFPQQNLEQELGEISRNTLSAVRMGFKGSFSGNALLLFPPESANNLVSVLTGEDSVEDDMDAIRTGTLTEIGNIVINGVMGSISNAIGKQLSYSVPSYREDSLLNMLQQNHDDVRDATIILARTHFIIEKHFINGDIILFFEVGSFDALLDCVELLLEKTR